MPTTLPNANQPLTHFEIDFTQGPPHIPGSSRMSINAKTRRTLVRNWSTKRGRQYELDQVQAGQLDCVIVDPLEYLNPLNGASPFNTAGNTIKPYRAMWVWAMWPTIDATLRNINQPLIDPAYDPSFEASSSSLGGWTATDGTATVSNSTTHAHSGTRALKTIQAAGGAGKGTALRFRTAPGITYTFSAYVWPDPSVTVQIKVTAADGTVYTSATASTASAWTRLSVTWTTVDTLERVEIFATGGTFTFWADDIQLEFGDTPSAYTAAGPTAYPIYTGYVERYPLTYDMHGERHITPLTAVDALSVLSRTEIVQTYALEIANDAPLVVVPLTDSAGPHQVQQSSGAPMNPWDWPAVTGGMINYGGDQFPDGTNVITLNTENTQPPIAGDPNYITAIGSRGGPVGVNMLSITFDFWLKFISGVAYIMMTPALINEDELGATGPQNWLGLYTAGGQLNPRYDDPNGTSALYGVHPSSYNGYPDGQWHYHALTLYGSGLAKYTVDNVEVSFSLVGAQSANLGITGLQATNTTYFLDAVSKLALAYMAVYPIDIGASRRQIHYLRGVGYINEASGARVTRLLTQYWAGPMSVATGVALLSPDHDYNRRKVLEVLQEIQETERGLAYVNRSGTVVFEDRQSRYTNQTSLWVFGENPAGASPVEYPYTDYAGDFDPTYTFSQANLTRPGNSDYPPRVNAAAQTDYGQRVLTHTMQVNTDFDLEQAGIYYLNRYANAKVRITKIVLDPAANPALWPVVLSLEISQRVTVKRRSSGLTTSFEYYIEQINHAQDSKNGTWKVELQLSPVFVPTAWILGDATYGVLGTTTVPTY